MEEKSFKVEIPEGYEIDTNDNLRIVLRKGDNVISISVSNESITINGLQGYEVDKCASNIPYKRKRRLLGMCELVDDFINKNKFEGGYYYYKKSKEDTYNLGIGLNGLKNLKQLSKPYTKRQVTDKNVGYQCGEDELRGLIETFNKTVDEVSRFECDDWVLDQFKDWYNDLLNLIDRVNIEHASEDPEDWDELEDPKKS